VRKSIFSQWHNPIKPRHPPNSPQFLIHSSILEYQRIFVRAGYNIDSDTGEGEGDQL